MTAKLSAEEPLCQCGCGSVITKIYKRTRGSQLKGSPYKFLTHHEKGRPTNAGYFDRVVNGRRKKAHVLIVEKVLGRELPVGAQVHHFDGNKRNNAHGNLVVCPNQAYHMLLHSRQRVVAAGGNPNTQHLCTRCKQPFVFADLKYGSKERWCSTCWPARLNTAGQCPHCHKQLACVSGHLLKGHCPVVRREAARWASQH